MNVQYTPLSPERRKRFRNNYRNNKQNALRYFIAKLKKLSHDYLKRNCVEDYYAPVFERIVADAISVGCNAECYCDGCSFWDAFAEKCKVLSFFCEDILMGHCIHAVIRDMELELELEKKESKKRRQWKQMSRYSLYEWNVLLATSQYCLTDTVLLGNFHRKEDGVNMMLERASQTEAILVKNFGKDAVARHTDESKPGILEIIILLNGEKYQHFTLKRRKSDG